MNEKKITCLAVDDEPPALEVLKKFITSIHLLELAATCSDLIEAMNFLQSRPVGLIFLDIKMPELLETDFVRALKNSRPLDNSSDTMLSYEKLHSVKTQLQNQCPGHHKLQTTSDAESILIDLKLPLYSIDLITRKKNIMTNEVPQLV